MLFRQVCRQVAEWQSKGTAVPVTVNLSARQFQDPELFARVARALDEFQVRPELIKFELTESTAMIDMDKAAEIAGKLKQRGIDIIVDDFGSGYSSMIWLKYLKPVAIKIDRFFIQNLAFNSADAAIVKAIIFLAHSLDMVVIAEGIETEEQLKAIQALRPDYFDDLSCDHGQGYLFSRPVSASMVETLFPAPSQP
jgi:EAL domain-containing protein (putative c-di-GMP-specific phosphodiesterase class I)